MIFGLAAGVACIFAVPICLGMLLRMLMRRMPSGLVAWIGAALGFAAQHCTAEQDSVMKSIMDFSTSTEVPFPAKMGLAISGVLISFSLWFIFVNMGVGLVERNMKERSNRFLLIAIPIIAETVNICIIFILMCFFVEIKDDGMFHRPFFLHSSFLLAELVVVPLGAFAITFIRLYKRRQILRRG